MSSIDPRGHFLREGLQIDICPRCGARVVVLGRIHVELPPKWEFGNTYSKGHECPKQHHETSS